MSACPLRPIRLGCVFTLALSLFSCTESGTITSPLPQYYYTCPIDDPLCDLRPPSSPEDGLVQEARGHIRTDPDCWDIWDDVGFLTSSGNYWVYDNRFETENGVPEAGDYHWGGGYDEMHLWSDHVAHAGSVELATTLAHEAAHREGYGNDPNNHHEAEEKAQQCVDPDAGQ